MIRWGVRGVLMLGVVASTIANILHAEPNGISRTIAAWPPLALLLTIELISRIPVHQVWLALTRLCATAAVAGIAAWVSYWHMTGVALRYGESPDAAHLMPLSVDGLIVVASICLVELGGRDRAAEESTQGGSNGQDRAEDQGQGGLREGVVPAGRQGAEGDPQGAPGDVPEQQEEVAEESTRGGSDGAVQQQRQAEAEQRDSIERQLHTDGPDHSEAAQGDGVAAADRQEDPRETAEVAPAQIEPPRPAARKPHTTNPDRVRRAYERTPEADPAAVARRLKLSLATVKKYRPPKGRPEQVNGKAPDLEEVSADG
jgi:hypothetical protein